MYVRRWVAVLGLSLCFLNVYVCMCVWQKHRMQEMARTRTSVNGACMLWRTRSYDYGRALTAHTPSDGGDTYTRCYIVQQTSLSTFFYSDPSKDVCIMWVELYIRMYTYKLATCSCVKWDIKQLEFTVFCFQFYLKVNSTLAHKKKTEFASKH